MTIRSWNPTAVRPALDVLLVVSVAAIALTTSQAPGAPDRPTTPAPKALPVVGTCRDETGQALAGVKVTLYREDYKAKKQEKLAERETGADGGFEFHNAPAIEDDRGIGVAFTKSGRGSIVWSLHSESLRKPLEVQLRPAATLQGRVTDEAGKPVSGARVWTHSLRAGPLDGISSTVTDADGKYAITDMGRWNDEDAKPKPIGNGLAVGAARVYFDIRHPDFARERPTWERIPCTVDVVLQRGGVIEGKVTDRKTGKPAAGVTVSLQGIKGMPSWDQTRTDAEGMYQIRCLKAGQYNLWADAPDRACAAIDSLTVTAGKTLGSQDLTLVEGGWIEGRVVDAATGGAITGTPDRPLYVANYGPGRPKSGAACQSTKVDENGWFRLRVAPGTNYPYIMTPDIWNRTEGRKDFQAGIAVKEGEPTKIVFMVAPAKPR
jgi:5-hydroxyisourate hydrolase-like protein (transthyretin family)